MSEQGIQIEHWPKLENPVLIAGFEGWGNALDISSSMVSYMIRRLGAVCFARLNPDLFYRYDESRPIVNIEEGTLKGVSLPGGSFYSVETGSSGMDLVILKANEPTLRWLQFVDDLFSLCRKLEISTIITLGSMYDNVLHSDRIISAISSSDAHSLTLKEKNVIPINYRGPSAIHSTIHSEGQKRGFECISLWCHCPYYLQGATHFGLLSHLGALLSSLGGFELDREELDISWKELNKQIQGLIEKNPELQGMISELRKAKVRGSWASMKESEQKDGKVIQIADFLKPN
jgi:proteasome assembly chaperone (PAC2) family protein